MIETVQTTIVTADDHAIVARFFSPEASPKGSVLIVPAMGVAQAYYAPLAEWLAGQGFFTATFDFRGIGLSRKGGLRGFEAGIIEHWAQRDCAAMLDALGERVAGAPLYWIGHSLGAQIFPFVPNGGRVAKMITVAGGAGYWRENAPPLRRVVWWLWYVIAPLAVRLFGYFPGRRLGIVGDLPRGVMEQWRRWCLDPEYVVGAEGAWAREHFARVTTPIVSLSFTDDEFMSARNTESLHAFYVNAPCNMKRLAPGDVGAKRIGHFGFFRPACEKNLWEKQLLPELV